MKFKTVRAFACTLAVITAFGSFSLGVKAAPADSILPAGGVELTLSRTSTSLDSIAAGQKQASKIASIIEKDDIETEETIEETEHFENLVIAKVSSYVNVRDEASEKGKILGKLYNKSVGEFLGEENGWYLIQSGNVTGYVKAEFCVTGDEANELAPEVGTRLATIETTTLFVRSEATTESSIIGMVPFGDEFLIYDETDDFVQVDTEEGKGWISKDYISIHTEFVKAESKEEEKARLEKEAAERRKAREAANKAMREQAATSSDTTEAAPVTTYSVGEGSELGKAVAEYGLQFVGNPYVWGGTSLTNGCDCSGFVMKLYEAYGVSLPHSSSSDRKQGYAVDGLENAQAGDLICYSGHVALYIGDGKIVHASSKKTGIIVSKADYKKILAIRRIF